MFILKCSYVNEEFDLKTKKWVMSKKTPCKLLCAFSGERPVHLEIKKVIKTRVKNCPTSLEEQLKLLFSFLHISNCSSTLDELNLLVQHKLKRLPRKVFYFPTTTLFMKESHRETFKEYETRIFSEKIIDRSYVTKLTLTSIKKPPVNSNFINVLEEESDNESNESNNESEKDADSNRDESDYSETDSVAEIEEEEEIFDDLEDYDDSGSNDESGY